MLITILHNQINNIIPIEGVADNGDGSFRIDYINEPSSSQLDEIENIVKNWPLTSAKIVKLEILDQNFQKELSLGWTTPYGWNLGLTTQDVALLNGNFTLAKEASYMGLNNPIFIVDTNGEAHELSLQDLTVLMLQYGQFRVSMSNNYANKKKLIQNAISLDELAYSNMV
jgi:hypothetical protein